MIASFTCEYLFLVENRKLSLLFNFILYNVSILHSICREHHTHSLNSTGNVCLLNIYYSRFDLKTRTCTIIISRSRDAASPSARKPAIPATCTKPGLLEMNLSMVLVFVERPPCPYIHAHCSKRLFTRPCTSDASGRIFPSPDRRSHRSHLPDIRPLPCVGL